MPQLQGQYNLQTQQQQLKLSPLQLLTARLLELPLTELEERVKNEIIDNIGLESKNDDDAMRYENDNESDHENGDDDGGNDERDLDEADNSNDNQDPMLGDYASPDDIPSYLQNRMEVEHNEMPLGDSISFIDDLREQLSECDLTDHQQELVDFLIGSLNDNGFLDTPLRKLADEMLFSHNIETSEEELSEMLTILQQFEPAGIGARDSRECLLLQIDRKMQDREHLLGEKYFLLEDGRRIIDEHFDLFLNNNTEKLQHILNIPAPRMRLIMDELRKLNLYPGLALCESANDRIQSAVPDFIIETDGEGSISFHLNKGELPELHLSREYTEQLRMLEASKRKLSRSEQEFVNYTRQKLESARNFIEAIRQRHHTLNVTMKAIIDLQRPFFLSQLPEDLNRMVLKDVADKAKLDISTVSRVCNSKYCLLDGRLYSLRHFFKRTRNNSEGDEVDAEKVREAIKAIVAKEDKSKPFNDDQLSEELKKFGISIRRRTVAKYRDEIGIPIAKKREK